jgi:predicted O-methyltransferase YrrM
MTAKHLRDGLNLTHQLLEWVRDTIVRETETQQIIRQSTAKRDNARMMIPPEQGQTLGLLARMVGAKRAIEVGSFTGYSATWIASALGPGGHLVACDLSDEYLAEARGHWKRAGLEARIEVRTGRAVESMDALIAEGQAGTFDFVFVDADKTGYAEYFERALVLLRVGGVVVFDNALWSGSVADLSDKSPSTGALRDLAGAVANDARVYASMLTDGDGLLVAYKLPEGDA